MLQSLNKFKSHESKPSTTEMIRYIFWKKGIGFHEFNSYPLPYIFSIVSTYSYIKDKEDKELNKNKKGKK